MDIEDLVTRYIAARDRKKVIMDAAKKKCEQIDAALEVAEAALLKFLNENGIENVKTAAGTAYKSVSTSATVGDWDQTLEFIKANDAWHMLERRVSKVAVEEYIAETQDLPPGVNWKTFTQVNIRR